MAIAREIMTPDPRCAAEDDTLVDAARMMKELDVGALPICGEDGRLKGMLTDRDIVVKCLAEGGDPRQNTAGSLAQGRPVYVEAEDGVEEVLRLMKEHQIRRIPVIEDHELVGIISQADVALSLPLEATGETVERISA